MKQKELEVIKDIYENADIGEEKKEILAGLIIKEEKRYNKTQTKAHKNDHILRDKIYYQEHKEEIKMKRRQRYKEKGY